MLCVIEFFNLKRLSYIDLSGNGPFALNLSMIVTVFFVTGLLYYIIIYILNLILVIPLPAKDETEEEMKARLAHFSQLFKEKMNNIQARPIVTIAVTVIVIPALIINSNCKIASHDYITDYAVIIILFPVEKVVKFLFAKIKKYILNQTP